MPLVSVIIPAFGHGQFICQTIKSVFDQTFTDYEILVVNDGSPDNTAERVLPLAEAGLIRYFEQANSGQASARNRGLIEARGRYIAFLDDDDLWPPDKLSWQIEWLDYHPSTVAVGGWCELFQEHRVVISHNWHPTGIVDIDSLSRGNPCHSPGQMLIRASVLNKVGGFDPNVWGADDFDLCFKLCEEGLVEMVPRVALHYRVHHNNASRNAGRMFCNILMVGQRHLVGNSRGDRKRLENFNLYLYSYAGRRLLSDWRYLMKGYRDAMQWWMCVWWMLVNPTLWRLFQKDVFSMIKRRIVNKAKS